MKKKEVIEILEYKIVLEKEREFPNEETIKALSESIHLINLIDDFKDEEVTKDNVVCLNCGESLKECACNCKHCDTCDECTCCNSEEDFLLAEDEINDIISDVFTGLLRNIVSEE